jgi:phytanoyl-CoA hydroxylase
LLVHHSLTIHRADGNKSIDRTRKALGLIYYAERAKENVKAKEEYQRKLAEEIKQKSLV